MTTETPLVLVADDDSDVRELMTERETAALALHAAETGRLVLTTLAAGRVAGALERLVGLGPPGEREGVLGQLAGALRAVVAQRALPRGDGKGRVPVLEILLNTPRIQPLVRRGELDRLSQAIEEGGEEAGQSLDQALVTLCQQGRITADDAVRAADRPDHVRHRLARTR